MKKELQISTELQKVIDALKFTIDIVSISEADGVSTIVTASNDLIIFNNLSKKMRLQDDMIIEIENTNYQVSNVTHTTVSDSFDITATDLTATEFNIACNFQVGSRKEINEILKQEQNDDNKLKRFPLIWLIYSDKKDYSNNVLDFTSTLNLAFAYKSNKTDRTVTRIDNNISPVIQPLLKLFLLWLQSTDFNYMFEFFGYEKPIEYEVENFPYYGTENESVLEISTDAIEIELDLNFKQQYEY